jgi:hypothetical protein
VFKGFLTEMQRQGIAVYTAEVRTGVTQFAERTGLAGMLGEGRGFPTVDAAVRALESS